MPGLIHKNAERWPQEIVIAGTKNRAVVQYATAKGELRRIAPKLFTPNFKDTPETIIRRNVWQIGSALFPGGLIADRTALENRPGTDGSVFLIADRTTDLILPGIAFRPRAGVGPIEGSDRPFIDSLWTSSQARALLENMRPSRSRGKVRRTLSREEMEHWIDALLRKGGGDTALNRLRSEFKALAGPLRMEEEALELDGIIGTMLGTRSAKLVTHVGIARAQGLGYDPERLSLFEELRAGLGGHFFKDRGARSGQVYLPFFEAYFSNFIEGTEFRVDEARAIVYEGVTPLERPEDAHDVLGTFNIVSDDVEMRKVPGTPEEFIERLCFRHSVILAGRPSKHPGEFKTRANQFGETLFVDPSLVQGTLMRGYELLNTLEHPMARAIFAMFLVAEVHPFDDGNGRVARVMMNGELVSQGQERIIIPSVFRSEYLQSLKAHTHNHRVDGLIRVLDFAQSYVSEIEFADYAEAERVLRETNAFKEPANAMGDGAKLLRPSSLTGR